MKFNIININLLLIIIAFGALFVGCSTVSYPESVAEVDASIDDKLGEAIAIRVCQMSNGNLPNWPLHPKFTKWMTPSEARAVRFVAHSLKSKLYAEQIPNYYATARFIEMNTSCKLVRKIHQDNRTQFIFEQTAPVVPIDVVPKVTKIDPKALEEAWLQALNQAWDKNNVTQRTIVTALDFVDSDWVLATEVEESFAHPLELRQKLEDFATALELGQFEEAEWAFTDICRLDSDVVCNSLQEQISAAKTRYAEEQSLARATLELSNQTMKLVQPPNASAYTVVSMSVKNKGESRICDITMKTNEIKPQYCALQSVRHNKQSSPVCINPGESINAFCPLSEMTLPIAKLEFVSVRH